MEPSRICPRCHRKLPAGLEPKDCPTCLVNAVRGPGPDDLEQALKLVGTRFDNHELTAFIARGGMGDVYRARQCELHRDVAVKVAREERVFHETDRRRFKSDAEVAAQLDHPNIVRVFNVGEIEGRPYFSMQLIEGCSLADLLTEERKARAPRPSGDRLRFAVTLMIKVSRAVHYAHTRGVLHRDLKPGNILLNHAEEPFLADFGLAKRMEDDLDMTLWGEIVGTIHYMPPEQAQGATGKVTVFSDIYSLGAILYELLTGRTPHEGRLFHEVLHKVIHDTVASPRARNDHIERDLETICLKCLDQDPNRRYGSAEELADDLECWLCGKPIRARPVPWWERVWKWIRRNPDKAGWIGAATALGLMLVLAGFGIRHLVQRHYQQRGFLQAAAQFETGRPAAALAALSGLVDSHPGFDLASDRLICALTQHPIPTATLPHPELVVSMAYSPDGRHLVTADETNTLRVWNTLRGDLAATFTRPSGNAEKGATPAAVQCVVFHPNGDTILAGYADGRVRTWNWRRPSLEHETNLEGLIRAIRVQPDGSRVLVVSTRELRITDATSGRTWGARADGADFFCTAFDPQGRYVATGNMNDGAITLWTGTQATLVSRWQDHRDTVRSLRFSADGTLLVSSSDDGTVCLRRVDAPGAEPVVIPHDQPVWSAMLDAEGRRILTLSGDHQVRLWDAATGGLLLELPPDIRDKPTKDHHMSVALFHPLGGYVLTACDDGKVRVWEATTGQPFGLPAVHELRPPFNEFPFIDLVVVARDGSRFATVGADRAVRLWGFPGRQVPVRPFRPTPGTLTYGVSRQDRWAWARHEGGLHARQLFPQSGELLSFPCPPVRRLFPSPTAALTLAETESGQMLLVGQAHDSPLALGTNHSILQAGWTTDGARFWMRTEEQLAFYELEDPGSTVVKWPLEQGILWCAPSPDDAVMGWATVSNVVLQPLALPDGAAMRVPLPGAFQEGRFSTDGSRLLVTAMDGLAILVDARRGSIESLFHHDKAVQSADLNRDGSVVVTLTAGKDLAYWRAGHARKPWRHHELEGFRANSIALSGDGRRLALASPGQFLMLMDVESGQALSDPVQTESSVRNVRFAAEDTWIMADLQDSPILWEVPPDVGQAPDWLAQMGRHAAALLTGEPDSTNGTIAGARQILSLALGAESPSHATARWARWFYADSPDRTVSPSSNLRAMDHLFEHNLSPSANPGPP